MPLPRCYRTHKRRPAGHPEHCSIPRPVAARPLSHNDHSFSQTLFWCYPGKQCLKFTGVSSGNSVQNHPAFPLETLFENSPTRPENNVLTALNPREDLTDFLFRYTRFFHVTVTMTAGRTFFSPGVSSQQRTRAPHQHGQPECRESTPI